MGETCKEVPAEEYVVIHVVQATTLYTRLQFSLLASSWLRPVGVCLWSVLHTILVVYVPVMLLAVFSTVLGLAVFIDAIMWSILLNTLLIFPLVIVSMFLGLSIASALVWVWLVVSCQCCTMAGRSPGQSLGRYIVFAGGKLSPPHPQPGPAVEELGPAGPPAGRWAAIWNSTEELRQACVTRNFCKHVKLVSFPYWRSSLKKYCHEMVPLYDAVVI